MPANTPFISEFASLFKTLNFASHESANALFAGKAGRGNTNSKLASWLQASSSAFSEPISVSDTDHITDEGIDIDVRGQRSKDRVAFQVKSDNDLRDGFLSALKRQYTDARASGNLRLFIVVFACSVSQYNKYKSSLNQALHKFPDWIVVPPEKAATLFQRFEKPLSSQELQDVCFRRDWQSFFSDTKETRGPEFIDHWSRLSPQDRFVPPASYHQITNYIKEEPLTVIVGPPTVGKTFIAVIELYKHYQSGKPVKWIDGNVGGSGDVPVVVQHPTQGLSSHVRYLVSKLGIDPPSIPVAPTEFVATTLRPDSLVLIEDPFGATDADYKHSLASYDFFAIHRCVEALTRMDYPGCSIIITSRQGLFDRWIAELHSRSIPTPKMRLIGLSSRAYEFDFMHRRGMTRKVLARKLLEARVRSDSYAVSEKGLEVLQHMSTPFEIEQAVSMLSASPSLEEMLAARDRVREGYLAATEFLCKAEKADELLFLFLLVSLTEGGYHGDHKKCFAEIYPHFIEGDPNKDYAASSNRYWGITSVSYDDANQIKSVRPAHSCVVEAIQADLKRRPSTLGSIGLAIASDTWPKDLEGERQRIVSFLIFNKEWLSDEVLAILIGCLEPRSEVVNLRDPSENLIGQWQSLPAVAREALLSSVEKQDTKSVLSYCSLLQYHKNFPIDDAERLYAPLLAHLPSQGGLLRFGAYDFLARRSLEFPKKTRAQIAHRISEDVVVFAKSLGPSCLKHWNRIPTLWRDAMLSHVLFECPDLLVSAFYWLSTDSQIPPAIEDHVLSMMHSVSEEVKICGAEIACWYSFKNCSTPRLKEKLDAMIMHEEPPSFGLRLRKKTNVVSEAKGDLIQAITSRLEGDEIALLISYELDDKEQSSSLWDRVVEALPRASNLAYSVIRLYQMQHENSSMPFSDEELESRCDDSQLDSIIVWHAILEAAQGKCALNIKNLVDGLQTLKGVPLYATLYIIEHQAPFLESEVVQAVRTTGLQADPVAKRVVSWAQKAVLLRADKSGRDIPNYPWDWYVEGINSPPKIHRTSLTINFADNL